MNAYELQTSEYFDGPYDFFHHTLQTPQEMKDILFENYRFSCETGWVEGVASNEMPTLFDIGSRFAEMFVREKTLQAYETNGVVGEIDVRENIDKHDGDLIEEVETDILSEFDNLMSFGVYTAYSGELGLFIGDIERMLNAYNLTYIKETLEGTTANTYVVGVW
jgi:hypothetical protein